MKRTSGTDADESVACDDLVLNVSGAYVGLLTSCPAVIQCADLFEMGLIKSRHQRWQIFVGFTDHDSHPMCGTVV